MSSSHPWCSRQASSSDQSSTVCEFGQNPSTGSEDNTRKPYFGHFRDPVTLKIKSRSPKFNPLFPSSQQYIYVSMVKTHPLVKKITHGNHILDILKLPIDLENKVKVTKI